MNKILWIAVFVVGSLWVSLAIACIAPPQKHEVDEAAAFSDYKPPQTPHVEVSNVKRGKAPEDMGNGVVRVVSTDGTGIVSFRVPILEDDKSSADEIGLRVRCSRGCESIPALYVPDYDIRPRKSDSGYAFALIWQDGRQEGQEPIEFEIEVYAVDRAGNVSRKPAVVIVQDPGRHVTGE